MDRKQLADEIRAAGYGNRTATGVRSVASWFGDEPPIPSVVHHFDKFAVPDWKIVRQAATCSSCKNVASDQDIKLAEEMADCYQSFARLIWPTIDHTSRCKATPFLSVSEMAKDDFVILKAQFERKRSLLHKALAWRRNAEKPSSGLAKKTALENMLLKHVPTTKKTALKKTALKKKAAKKKATKKKVATKKASRKVAKRTAKRPKRKK